MQRTFRGVSAALVGLALAVLVGCTPTAAPSPIPTPSVPTCVPLDGASPFPCTQADFDALAEQRALYEEAETVVKRYYDEVNRQEADWQLRGMTPEFEATTTGDFREFTRQLTEFDRRDQASRVSGSVPVVWVRPALDEDLDGALVAVRSCVDGSQASYVTSARPTPQAGVVMKYVFYLSRADDVLKLSSSSSEQVDAC